MKSSTIRRSMLSKESMDVIENLAGENNMIYSEEDNTPHEYYREENSSSNIAENKAKEIDMLWQSFKMSQFNTNSPIMCYIGGILTGIILTLVVLFLFGTFSTQKATKNVKVNNTETNIEATSEENIAAPLPIEASNEENMGNTDNTDFSSAKMVKYVIKDGDTVEAIIKKHYGSYSPEKAEAIMKANNLKNLDRISIDQVLLIPMDK